MGDDEDRHRAERWSDGVILELLKRFARGGHHALRACVVTFLAIGCGDAGSNAANVGAGPGSGSSAADAGAVACVYEYNMSQTCLTQFPYPATGWLADCREGPCSEVHDYSWPSDNDDCTNYMDYRRLQQVAMTCATWAETRPAPSAGDGGSTDAGRPPVADGGTGGPSGPAPGGTDGGAPGAADSGGHSGPGPGPSSDAAGPAPVSDGG